MTTYSRRLLLKSTAAAFGAAHLPLLAQGADSFPSRPIRFLVPQPPGGGQDLLARRVGQKLSELVGQPVVVENKPGASGMIAGELLGKSPPDGHTIMVDQASIATNSLIYKKSLFDPRTDVAPLMLAGVLDNAILVNAESSIKSLADLIAQAKAAPGKLAYASSGHGTGTHLGVELLCAQAGIKMLHVPYKGVPAAITAVAANEVTLYLVSVATSQGFVKAGRVRAIATTGTARSPAMPNVPTVAEQGLPKYQNYNWVGIYTNAGTPKAVQEKLSARLIQALRDPSVSGELTKLGWEIVAGPGPALQKMFDDEIERFADLVRTNNMQLDTP